MIQKPKGKSNKNQYTFLPTLMTMLDENAGSSAIRWSEDGSSFIIEKTEAFFKLLPKYFKTNNYSSFIRQLNLYDFHKVKNESDFHEFKNPFFVRGSPELVSQIKRKVLEKGQPPKRDSDQESRQMAQNFGDLTKELEDQKADHQQKLLKLLVAMHLSIKRKDIVEKFNNFFQNVASNANHLSQSEDFKNYILIAANSIFENKSDIDLDAIYSSVFSNPKAEEPGLERENPSASMNPLSSLHKQSNMFLNLEISTKSKEERFYPISFFEFPLKESPHLRSLNDTLKSAELSDTNSVDKAGTLNRERVQGYHFFKEIPHIEKRKIFPFK